MKIAPLFLTAVLFSLSASRSAPASGGAVRIIVDSDANNELDDQHAIAYVLLNPRSFDIEGITVNRTYGGGDIEQQALEAERVVKLCGRFPAVPVYRGASSSFDTIRGTVGRATFDGCGAVDFIIRCARAARSGKLVVLAIGKLTNVALALCRDPAVVPRIRLVWLGSNYPEPGEYNFENDTAAVNYVLGTGVECEIAVVRYGKSTGTGAVQVTLDDIRTHMKGKGPRIASPVAGRNGGTFVCFGDYSVDLFEHVNERTRALYDLAAAALVRNPRWAARRVIPAPRWEHGRWVDQPANPRHITIRENFDRNGIIADLYRTMNGAGEATHAGEHR